MSPQMLGRRPDINDHTSVLVLVTDPRSSNADWRTFTHFDAADSFTLANVQCQLRVRHLDAIPI